LSTGTLVRAPREVERPVTARPERVVLGFVLFQVVCQLALLAGGPASVRLALRVAAFGASLVLLFALRRRAVALPAARAAKWAVAIAFLSVAHPLAPNRLAGFAQASLYLAVLAPLFWVPRLDIDRVTLRRVILALWAFHAASAATGVLQVTFPGRFEPALSPWIVASGEDYVRSLELVLPDGTRVFRPMGLTDVPGGACTGGLYAGLLGAALFLTERRKRARAVFAASMVLGFLAISLSQVRASAVVLAVSLAAIAALLALRGQARVTQLVLVGVLGTAASLALAVALGGDSVLDRFRELGGADAGTVYYRSRGRFLEETLSVLLPRYPLGAGIGRWGMMQHYFGAPGDPEPLWVEIQWTGWLLDGGLPLVLAYSAALLVALRTALAFALGDLAGEARDLWVWGAVLVGYDLGTLALTFDYPAFAGQAGLDFWLLNAVVVTACGRALARARRERAVPA
jgi:hypothetical protein